MRFHLPSFLIGCAVGAAAVVALPRLRPIAEELATAAYKLYDAAMARVAAAREDVEDFFAEARARAREPRRPANGPVASA